MKTTIRRLLAKLPSVGSDKDHGSSASWYQGQAERPKVILSTSRKQAFQRCALHLLPMATSTAIIVINFKGVFIGKDFDGPIKSETINLMFLQLAAKFNEVCIVASLGLVVLQAVRHELLHGEGLPLGLVGSGLTFSSFQMFFQQEFYKVLIHLLRHGTTTRRFCFVLLLIVSTLTAGLAGPSSATMLVPQKRSWRSGGTDVFLDGPPDDHWPTVVSADDSDVRRLCSNSNATKVAVCPAAGYNSLLALWSQRNHTHFIQQSVPQYAEALAGSRAYWPVSSPGVLVPPIYTLGGFRHELTGTSFVQPHAASAILLERTAVDWWLALNEHESSLASRVEDRSVSVRGKSAIVNAYCSPPQNLTAADRVVQFPTIRGRFGFERETAPHVVDNLGNTSVDHARFHWLHLPDDFGAASVAGVFESPWSPSNSTRVVVGCSAQSGWVPTDVRKDKYVFWSGWYPWNISFPERTPSWKDPGPGNPIGPTNGRIQLTDSFLEMLTPELDAVTGDWRPSTIESILSSTSLTRVDQRDSSDITSQWLENSADSQGRIAMLEAIMTNVLVDGLSRHGSHKMFEMSGEPDTWSLRAFRRRPDFQKRLLAGKTAYLPPGNESSEYTSLRATMFVSGFNFQRSLSTYLALAVLGTHLAITVAHIIWVFFHRTTSSSWASVSELLALAQNSRPAFECLQNTGAGINRGRTFAQVAKVRVRPRPGDPSQSHVELVFDVKDRSMVEHPMAEHLIPERPTDSLSSNDLWQGQGVSARPTPEITQQSLRLSATWPHNSNSTTMLSHARVNSRTSSPVPYTAKDWKDDRVKVDVKYS